MMKSLFAFISFLLLSFLISCSNNPNNNSVGINNSSGNLGLKIDKATIPSDVVLVRATLTRAGFDAILGEVAVNDTNSTDIFLNNLVTGTWNLVVEAFNSSSVVIYEGAATVEITAYTTTFVSLVLNPTNSDIGSINITVLWGNSLSGWNDFENNPVLTTTNNYFDQYGVLEPKVLYLNGLYKMWYLGLGVSASSHVLYAESNDGISWRLNSPNNIVLFPGTSGTWDSQAVSPGAIIYEDNTYKMYYTGFADQYGPWNIGLATSSDGIHWEKYPEPILNSADNWEYQLTAATVIHNNGIYYLFYTGRNLPEYKIGLATSKDGINFTRYSSNPILSKTKNWEGTGIAYPSVILENHQFKMIYMNYSSGVTGFGVAYSIDGMNWTKNSYNPFYTNNNSTNGWAAYKIAYPNFIKAANEYRIYYSGITSLGKYFKLGFMESPF